MEFWQTLVVGLAASIVGGLIAYFGAARATATSVKAAQNAQREDAEHRDAVEARKRREAACLSLLEVVSMVEWNLTDVVARRPPLTGSSSKGEVIEAVQQAERSVIPAVDDPVVRDRFHTLVRLILLASRHLDDAVPLERAAGDLRHYCWFVRLTLQAVVDGETLPLGDPDDRPHLNRGSDGSIWSPTHSPGGWDRLAESDLDDPQYRPITPDHRP
jgi:hypothetical protein